MTYLRVWEKLKLEEVKKHLLVVGELSAECFNCHQLGVDSKSHNCPNCGATFAYVGFRRKIRPQDLKTYKQERPSVQLVDFSDFKKAQAKKEARNLLDI